MIAVKYGDRIRTLRKNRGMSQEKLADILGVTKQTVSQYERSVRKPDVLTIEALCDIFNVSADYLLGMADLTVRFVGENDLFKLDAPEDPIRKRCLNYLEKLNEAGQQEALNRLMEMTELEKYTKK